MIVDGKETLVRKAQGIEFANQQANAVSNHVHGATQVSSAEFSDRLLLLCAASVIPGLGHFLLGIETKRCLSICTKTVLSSVLAFGLLSFLCLIAIWFLVDLPVAGSAGKDFGENPIYIAVCAWLTTSIFTLISPLILVTVFWGRYPRLIDDLKKEYAKRM